jgi:hypothetical protein
MYQIWTQELIFYLRKPGFIAETKEMTLNEIIAIRHRLCDIWSKKSYYYSFSIKRHYYVPNI